MGVEQVNDKPSRWFKTNPLNLLNCKYTNACLFVHFIHLQYNTIMEFSYILVLFSATQPTPSSNFVVVVLANNTVLCLLDGQPAASCSIRYGTDPTYGVLPNTDSAITGGVITLTSTLTGDTTYYIVSTTTRSLTMELRGSFTTCTTQDLIVSSTIVEPQSSCGEPTGDDPLACYSGVTPGSTVMYRCVVGSLVTLSGQSIRTCQSDGTWSGTTPSCVCTSEFTSCNCLQHGTL